MRRGGAGEGERVRWVGLVCTSTTSTDMAPSEGEDGVGWPGLCSLDRGASRRPMIGNQIAAHPSPSSSSSSSYLRPILCLSDSLPPPRTPWPPTIHPYSQSSQPYPELTPCNYLSFPFSISLLPSLSLSLSLFFPLSSLYLSLFPLYTVPSLLLSLSLSLSSIYISRTRSLSFSLSLLFPIFLSLPAQTNFTFLSGYLRIQVHLRFTS